MTTKAMPCKCRSVYQDERYGVGKRLHNPSADGKKCNCTICGDKKTMPDAPKKESKEKAKK